MHQYNRCNKKINITPKRDPKPLPKTPNYHPYVHPPKGQKHTHPQCQSLNNHSASAVHPHNDKFGAGRLFVHFLLDEEPAAGGFTMWSCSCYQATLLSVTTLHWQSAKRPRALFRMTSWYRSCLIILLWSFRSNFWKPAFVVGKLVGFGRSVSTSSSDSSPISLIISSSGGGRNAIQIKVAAATRHRRLGTRCAIALLARINDATKYSVVEFNCWLYPSGCSSAIEDWGNITGVWTTISIRLLPAAPNLTDFLARVWQTGNCRIHDWQNCHIDDSSTPGLCDENSWVLVSPTLFPAMGDLQGRW